MRISILFTLAALMLGGPAIPLCAQAPIATSMTLTASPTSVYPGTAVVFTATLSVASGSVSALNGQAINFYPSATPGAFALGYLNNGVATATITPSTPSTSGGVVPFTASFNEGLLSLPGYQGSQASTAVTVLPISSTALQAGQYIFLLQGTQFNHSMAAIGSLALDGNGNISGEEDLNSGTGVSPAVPVTGSYTFHSAGVGVLKLHSSAGEQQFTVFLPSPFTLTTPSGGSLLETDASAVGKGTLMLQTNGYLPDISGTYALDVRGESSNSNYGHDAGPAFVSGQLILGSPTDNTAIVGQASETIGTTVLPSLALTGNYGVPDDQGRFLFTASAGPGYADQPMHFAAYAIDYNDMVLLSLEPHSTFILLSGTGRGDR